MAKLKNELGSLNIAVSVFANLAGYAATSCYGVVGMANKNKADGFVSLLKKDMLDKGVKVTIKEDEVSVDLYVVVEYGINIKAVCESIIERVKYSLESATGFVVKKVTVYVESVRVD